MKPLVKVVLTISITSKLLLDALIASAAIKNPKIESRFWHDAQNSSLAELSDGDGEMNDALEAELEKKAVRQNTPTQSSISAETRNAPLTKANSQDTDGGDETQEIPNEPNDRDGGDETHETN
ncbi:MAG: hypothetical protein Tsb0014_44710 [Pleurocapsa sp.]